MKKFLPILVIAILALIAVPAHADTTTCPSGAISLYLGPGFSCTTGSLTFSNFSFSSGGTNLITSTQVTVTPITSGPPNGDGFDFNPDLLVNNFGPPVSANQNEDVKIFYTITSTSANITDLHLGFNGSFTPGGSAEVTEAFCLNDPNTLMGGATSGTCSIINVTNPPTVSNNTVTFAGVSVLSVSKDMQVTTGGGATGGEAAISDVSNTYSQTTVPEAA